MGMKIDRSCDWDKVDFFGQKKIGQSPRSDEQHKIKEGINQTSSHFEN